MQVDSILKGLSSLINSMRAFGFHFARVTPGTTSPLKCIGLCIRKCQTWNAARIYAMITLAFTWLNALYYAVHEFEMKKAVGADLFVKLGTVSQLILSVLLRSA